MTVRFAELPKSIHGFINHYVAPDGEFDTIVINSLDPPSVQEDTYWHEMEHYRRGHFDDPRPLEVLEKEAENARKSV